MNRTALKAIRITAAAFLAVLTAAVATLQFAPGRVSDEAVSKAKAALARYLEAHPESAARSLAVVDYSQPSFMKRMMIVELQSGTRAFYRVAHGRNSGELYALRFSDVPESNMSSLGLFRVTKRYYGDHGLALRLDGLDSLRNRNAAMRDIVLHQARYVSIPYILLNLATLHGPMIGRSDGCFAVSESDIDEVVEKLADGGFIYAWVPTRDMR
ncbi:MAG: murein L,D-transpeptidase catalytic domain family protein [Chlorobiaceae bacterium]|nr:murein L,D-transpeptidase catalytic domain family protein [Chlorobiaceae bacterium]